MEAGCWHLIAEYDGKVHRRTWRRQYGFERLSTPTSGYEQGAMVSYRTSKVLLEEA